MKKLLVICAIAFICNNVITAQETGAIGISCKWETAKGANGTVYVNHIINVTEGSPAYKAGLNTSSYIISVNGKYIISDTLPRTSLIPVDIAESSVTLGIYSGGKSWDEKVLKEAFDNKRLKEIVLTRITRTEVNKLWDKQYSVWFDKFHNQNSSFRKDYEKTELREFDNKLFAKAFSENIENIVICTYDKEKPGDNFQQVLSSAKEILIKKGYKVSVTKFANDKRWPLNYFYENLYSARNTAYIELAVWFDESHKKYSSDTDREVTRYVDQNGRSIITEYRPTKETWTEHSYRTHIDISVYLIKYYKDGTKAMSNVYNYVFSSVSKDDWELDLTTNKALKEIPKRKK